jgi:hypothetical protein
MTRLHCERMETLCKSRLHRPNAPITSQYWLPSVPSTSPPDHKPEYEQRIREAMDSGARSTSKDRARVFTCLVPGRAAHRRCGRTAAGALGAGPVDTGDELEAQSMNAGGCTAPVAEPQGMPGMPRHTLFDRQVYNII